MNAKDVMELRGQLKTTSKSMQIYKMATAYIVKTLDGAQIKSVSIRDFSDLPEEEQGLYLKMLKKCLSGKMGKNLMEYAFIQDETGSSSLQKSLYQLVSSRLEEESIVRAFLDAFAAGAGIMNSCLVTLLFCEYNVPEKDKNDEIIPGSTASKHRFILAAVNDVSLTNIGLYFNEDDNAVEKKVDIDMQVLPAPSDGFMFPVFTERGSDVNHVLYYSKTPKKPNEMLIENILGASSGLTHAEESVAFKKFLDDVASDELSLDLVSHIHGSVRDLVSQAKEDSEMETISRNQMKSLLEESGLSEKKLQLFDAAYDQHIGQSDLKAVNVLDSDKMSVKMPDIFVTIKGDAAYKVKTKMIDGRQYLLIAMDEGLQVDGLDVSK